MELEIKVTKNKQHVMQALLNAPGSLKDLKHVANPSGSQISTPRVKSAVFDPMVEAKWVTLGDDEIYRLTDLGVEVTQTHQREEDAKAPRQAVKANLFVQTGLYDGAELKRVAYRPGAFDYLACPSLINGVSTPYFVK